MELLAARAPWFVAGPLVGLMIVLLLWLTNQPFGALGGYIEFTQWVSGARERAGWRVLFLIGVVAGGLISALLGPGWTPTIAYGSFDRLFGERVAAKTITLLIAGGLMGVGGRMAGGCTSGHGVCGTSFGSRASLVSTATFMAVAIASAHLIAWFAGGGS
jgi:uncharacterized membrane protein YedE/YeeE